MLATSLGIKVPAGKRSHILPPPLFELGEALPILFDNFDLGSITLQRFKSQCHCR